MSTFEKKILNKTFIYRGYVIGSTMNGNETKKDENTMTRNEGMNEARLEPTSEGNYEIVTCKGVKTKIKATHELQRELENQPHVLEDGSYLLSELHREIEDFEKILERAKKKN